MRLSAERQPRPKCFFDRNMDARNLRIISDELLHQMKAKLLDRFDGMLPRERVHGVFHRIRRENFGVVALGVGGLEIAFKANRDVQLANVMAALLARDAQEADTRFTVTVFVKMDRHASAPAPAIGGIAERTEQKRHVIPVYAVVDAENDRNLGIERADALVSEIGARLERQPIGAFDNLIGVEQIVDSAVAIGRAAGDLLPSRADLFDFEEDGHAGRGPSYGNIDHVCGDWAG